jgi:hypothetical protein
MQGGYAVDHIHPQGCKTEIHSFLDVSKRVIAYKFLTENKEDVGKHHRCAQSFQRWVTP